MTTSNAGPPSRAVRTIARPAITWALALGIGLGASAAPAVAATSPSPSTAATGAPTTDSAGTGTLASLQTRAQELADEIAADGRTLDELSASYQAAQINFERLSTRRVQLQKSMAATSAAAATARQQLKSQALLAYLTGGAPIINYVPDRPGLDPSLTVSYAEIVAGGQKQAVQAYRSVLDAETSQKSALDANARQVAATLGTVKSDAAQATATLATQQEALAEVKGQMAVEVAKVQAQRAAAEQAQERAALAARGDLPPEAGTATTAAATAPTTPARPAPTNSRAPTTIRPPISTSGPTAAPTTTRTTSPPTTAPPTTTPGGGTSAQAPGVNRVLNYARAQLGKPYQWGGAGPNSFDCSGLVMMAWDQAGIYFPHLAQDQYNLTARIPLSALIPGDLVFFGTPDNVYHVGIYIGSGNMIDAPETGQNVQVQSIYWTSLLGAGRVTTSS